MRINKLLKLIAILLLIVISLCSLSNNSYAETFSISKAELYSKGVCKSLLKNHNTGGTIQVTKVYYKSDGKEYPAYCLNVELDGVGEAGSYTVKVNKLVDNDDVRRVIINGYPYKSLDSLGVDSVDEAFTATKMAVYCVLYDYDKDGYKKFDAIGDAGERTLKAIKKIVTAARNSSDKKQKANIYIEEITSNWNEDTIDKNYISKEYIAKSNVDIKQFSLKIKNNKIDGIRLTDLENKNVSTFKNNNKFKVLIPIKELVEKGSFDLDIEAQVETKPILYGEAPQSSLQNYALSALSYEIGINNLNIDYPVNDTTITFEKLSDNSNEPLKNAKFNVYDENKKLVYENLVTDQNGLITIKGIIPGKYYLREIESPKGYEKYDEDIEFYIDYQDEKMISITNKKIKVISRQKIRKKLPVTGY